MDAAEQRELVRERYGAIAAAVPAAATAAGCCAAAAPDLARRKSLAMGYDAADLATLPEGADLGLGCGNPHAIAALRPGETVVDLGSGAGFDCLLAARQVGPGGRVIGVDMTHAMLARARANAAALGLANVEFRLGEIEHLPIADGTADVILSNCVINLAPDKAQVLREAYRTLKPGGRLAVSDVVSLARLPDALADDPGLLCACVSGAAAIADVETWLAAAGFSDIRVTVRSESRAMIAGWAPGSGVEDCVAAATIEARKPDGLAPL